MIDIAARAPDAVKIRGPEATREEILNLFNQQMENLRVGIHVSPYLMFLRSSNFLNHS
jgi:hypothetical protein